jgi:hypothetical protein
MAAMSTVLTEFSDSSNARTYTCPAHTAVKPLLVLQRRRVPVGAQVVLEDEITVVSTTEDSDAEILDQPITFSVKVRRSKHGIAADIAAALVIFRDIIAGDEFAATVDGQYYLS